MNTREKQDKEVITTIRQSIISIINNINNEKDLTRAHFLIQNIYILKK